MSGTALSVRELKDADIALIADYWARVDANHLAAMGVDRAMVPARRDFVAMLSGDLALALQERPSYYTIWEVNSTPMGHCNVNKIRFGRDAYMHMHVWHRDRRRQGIGAKLLPQSVRHFFGRLELQDLYCEPYALNPAPHAVLVKAGFLFVREYTTVPGIINFEQPVKRWHMSRSRYVESLCATAQKPAAT